MNSALDLRRAPFAIALLCALAGSGCSSDRGPGTADGAPPGSDGARVDGGVVGDGSAAADGALTPDGELPVSSSELIDDARRAGTLDEKMAAYYELLLQFAPQYVPAEYGATRAHNSLPSSNALRTVMQHLDEYGPDVKAAATAMTLSPDDPGWLVFSPTMKVHNAAAGGGLCRTRYHAVDPSKHRYFGAAIETTHFVIRVLLPDAAADAAEGLLLHKRLGDAVKSAEAPVGGSDKTSTFGAYLDGVYEYYRDTLKMPEPAALQKVKDHGGKVPLYVGLCDEPGMSDAFGTAHGWIFVSVKAGFEDAELRRVIVPHELFHVFQNVKHATASCADVRDNEWPWEAAAVAVEDLIAPQVKRWSGRFAASPLFGPGPLDPMDRCFRCPEEPLHTIHGGACKQRSALAARAYIGDYSKFILLKYLMRNSGLQLGDFWSSYIAASCDPKPVLEKDDYSKGLLADFQIALLAERKDAAKPAFDPEDRALFLRAGQKSLDQPTSEAARYTYRLQPSFYAKWGAQRVAPSDLSSDASLKRLDSTTLPLQPGGTHRLLLETSPKADDAHELRAKVELIPEVSGAQALSSVVLPLDADGSSPGRSWDPAAPMAWPYTNISTELLGDTSARVSSDETAPRFILVVLTSFGSQPVAYKLGLNHPAACEVACGDFYEKYLLQQQCPQAWCAKEPAESRQSCIDDWTKKLRLLVDGLMLASFCPYACSHSPHDLDMPPAAGDQLDWGNAMCDAAGLGAACFSTKMGFIPLHDWPKISCATVAP